MTTSPRALSSPNLVSGRPFPAQRALKASDLYLNPKSPMLQPPPIHVSVLRLRHRSTTHRYTLHFFLLLPPSRSTRVLSPILITLLLHDFLSLCLPCEFQQPPVKPRAAETPPRLRNPPPLDLDHKKSHHCRGSRRTREDVRLSRKILTRVSSCTSSKHPPPEPTPIHRDWVYSSAAPTSDLQAVTANRLP